MFAVLSLLFFSNISFASTQTSIQQAVEQGLSSNLEVLSSKMDISISEANEITAALRANPSLLIDSQLMPFSGQWQQDSSGGPVQKDIALSIPLDVSGKREQRKTLAKKLTEQKKIEFFIYQLQKSQEIKNLFVEILSIREKLELLKTHKEKIEQVNAIIKKRMRGSNSQPLLAGRIDIFVKKVSFDFKETNLLFKGKMRDFCLVLGQNGDCDVSLTGSIRDFSFKRMDTRENLSKFVSEHNPFAKQLIYEKESLLAEKKLIKREIWDDIVLSIGATYQEKQHANPSVADSAEIKGASSWMVGLTLPLPVFDRKQGELQKTDYSILKNEKQKLHLDMELENKIKGLVDLAKDQSEKIEEFEKAILPSAQKINNSAQSTFKVGNMTVLEYLDANQVYLDSYTDYYNNITQRASTEFEIQVLKGQL